MQNYNIFPLTSQKTFPLFFQGLYGLCGPCRSCCVPYTRSLIVCNLAKLVEHTQNMLNYSIQVSHGSVATRFWCGGILVGGARNLKQLGGIGNVMTKARHRGAIIFVWGGKCLPLAYSVVVCMKKT